MGRGKPSISLIGGSIESVFTPSTFSDTVNRADNPSSEKDVISAVPFWPLIRPALNVEPTSSFNTFLICKNRSSVLEKENVSAESSPCRNKTIFMITLPGMSQKWFLFRHSHFYPC